MANLGDIERIDRVVDDIVDLQAKLKDDVESRDAKLQKYEQLFDEMVKVKSDLEAKINSFDAKFEELMNANTNLEAKLESKNVRINCLENKIKVHESKIAALEAQKENAISVKGTAVLKAQNEVHNNVNEKRPHASEDSQITNKRIKINDTVNLSSIEQPKDVQRIINILSLASNLKEFFLPVLMSDPTWNLNFEYIPDFSDIEKTESNYVKASPFELKYDEQGLAVKVYKNPCIKGFVRLDYINRKVESIMSYNNTNEINPMKFENRMYRVLQPNKSYELKIRNGNMCHTLIKQPNGEITYHKELAEKGMWRNLIGYKFEAYSWTKLI